MTTSDGYALIMMFGTFIAVMLLMQADHSRPLTPRLPTGLKASYGNTTSEYDTNITRYNASTVVGNFLRVIESINTHSCLPDVAQADKSRREESATRMSVIIIVERHAVDVGFYLVLPTWQIDSDHVNVRIRVVVMPAPSRAHQVPIGHMDVASRPRLRLGAKFLLPFDDASHSLRIVA
ncbi:hypothetical protein DFJ58DRAFT_841882 [Suillus subalutaceus]|uniref:uncharacterized protein n=1 Tax=Suillus subalutaceus TaxID=48586 RepID=UPI001B861105|nr:uncharacterized protein DFJ58DRAFT_841882 [Suillus subalutaceus]KAG1852449.1 hypothetical protein DFJ58DRAFT_841882 [Suillus subalutaceus]